MSARKRRSDVASVSESPTIERSRYRSGAKSASALGLYAKTSMREFYRGLLHWSARPGVFDIDTLPLP
jgi:hypothetical protein